MAVNFEFDRGFRISANGRSMLLQSQAVITGITDQELADYAEWMDATLSGIRGVAPLPSPNSRLTPTVSANAVIPDFAFKFTSDAALEYWLAGSIRLNPISYYHTIENAHAQDVREGMGFVSYSAHGRDYVVRSQSGFNSVVLCTSIADAEKNRAELHKKFGPRLLKITSATAFADRIAAALHAERYSVQDVTYSDTKVSRVNNRNATEWIKRCGNGDMSEDFLEYLAANHLDEMIAASEPMSVFCKPMAYLGECERRFLFTLGQDVQEPLTVDLPELSEHIELIC